MPHYRYDEIHRQWVIFAPERNHRPTDYCQPPEPETCGECPFCPGNEAETPPEIFALRLNGSKPDQPGWQVRVFPNKFPALTIDNKDYENPLSENTLPGFGVHEVIVETPEHNLDLPDMPDLQVEIFLNALTQRVNSMQSDSRFQYILPFRNYGYYAGATYSHPHTQIIAMPIIPSTVQVELDAAEDFYRPKKLCWFCQMIDKEFTEKVRLIDFDENLVALAPFASRMPFEMMILPRKHTALFTDNSPDILKSLAQILKSSLGKFKRIYPGTSYNLLLHSAPNIKLSENHQPEPYYHWHIEVLPRLVKTAGFEIGAGFSINTALPEKVAEALSSVVL